MNIEFNAWDIQEKEMRQVTLIDLEQKQCDLVDIMEENGETIHAWTLQMPLESIVLLQYTRKKDSYGAKLFQGDVIRARYKAGVVGASGRTECMPYERVVTRECYLLIKDALNFQKPERIGGITSSFLNMRKPIWKKMGNIYQNPELKKLL